LPVVLAVSFHVSNKVFMSTAVSFILSDSKSIEELGLFFSVLHKPAVSSSLCSDAMLGHKQAACCCSPGMHTAYDVEAMPHLENLRIFTVKTVTPSTSPDKVMTSSSASKNMGEGQGITRGSVQSADGLYNVAP
jgi:hypothetical protein